MGRCTWRAIRGHIRGSIDRYAPRMHDANDVVMQGRYDAILDMCGKQYHFHTLEHTMHGICLVEIRYSCERFFGERMNCYRLHRICQQLLWTLRKYLCRLTFHWALHNDLWSGLLSPSVRKGHQVQRPRKLSSGNAVDQ